MHPASQMYQHFHQFQYDSLHHVRISMYFIQYDITTFQIDDHRFIPLSSEYNRRDLMRSHYLHRSSGHPLQNSFFRFLPRPFYTRHSMQQSDKSICPLQILPYPLIHRIDGSLERQNIKYPSPATSEKERGLS